MDTDIHTVTKYKVRQSVYTNSLRTKKTELSRKQTELKTNNFTANEKQNLFLICCEIVCLKLNRDLL